MRERVPLVVLLVSSLAFLASLYLTWVAGGPRAVDNSPTGVLDLFSGISYGGWGPYGQAAAVMALALGAAAGASLLRPRMSDRLPLATSALSLVFFAVLDAAEAHGSGVFRGAFERVHVHLALGAYVGVASAAVACFAVLVLRWGELFRRPSTPEVLAQGLTFGVLAAFLLPWLHVRVPHVGRGATGYQITYVGDDAVIFAAAGAIFALLLWRRGTPPGRRLGAVAGIAVLVGASLSPLGVHRHWPYEVVLELGCVLGLLVLALATARDLRIPRPAFTDLAAVAAAALLVVSLSLPWDGICAGTCAASSGWAQADTVTAGGLAVILAALLLGSGRFAVELAVAAAIYVTAAGVQLTELTRLGYGAPLGFAGAALLLLASAARLRTVPINPRRVLVRLVPIATCLAFLAIPVAALTSTFPSRPALDSPWRVFWLEVAAIVVALRLLGRWLTRPRHDEELVSLPLALLALTTLDLIVIRSQIGWEGWASAGLCVLLLALGWFERSRGLRGFRLPEEIWRVDRLPEPES